jgi:uncharacterized membrane protein YdbT with pleckstrin-like domain
MSRVDSTSTKIAGRVSVLHFWAHFVGAGALAMLAWGGALGAFRPWGLAIAALLVARAASVIVLGTRWWVTDQQIVQSVGVVSRHTSEIEIQTLEDVEVRQGWIGRWLDVGSVLVRGQDRRVVLSGVRHPATLAQLLRGRRDAPPTNDA